MSPEFAGVQIPDGYRVEQYGQAGCPDADALIAFWVGQGTFDAQTAAQRVHEALFVTVGPGEEVAGVATVSLQHSRQLRLSFWHYAVVVGAAHRRRHLSRAMTRSALAHLEERWVSGQDRRGSGFVLEFQNKALLSHFRQPAQDGYVFVGLNRGGHPLAVRYFPGATAAPPPAAPQPASAPAPARAAPVEGAGPGTGPVFVVAPPGSGGIALRDTLASSPDLEVRVPDAAPHPRDRGWEDDRLEADDASAEAIERLRTALGGDRRALVHRPADVFQVPFLHAAFPDATFVYLYRDPSQSVPAALAAWESGWDASYPDLPGWDGPPWSFALVPGWRSLRGLPLAEVVAAQWEAATPALVRDQRRLPAERWSVVDYADLTADPGAEVSRLGRFAGFEAGGGEAPEPPPPDNAPLSPTGEITSALERTADTAEVARTLFASAPPVTRPGAGVAEAQPAAESPPTGVASASLTQVLAGIRSTVLAAAPGAGTVSVIRRAGASVHTAFAPFARPAALAFHEGVLAVGTRGGVTTYHDVPAAGQRLSGTMARDACFIPLGSHYTGEVGLRDMAFAEGRLWLVAGRFSCLATLDGRNSFVPRWLPPFVTELAGDDRCHLNGLCVVDDAPRYVTALGATDVQQGWKQDREAGGVVVDVPSGEVVASGLHLPHAPRWHRDRLWLLESGRGALGTVDIASGSFEPVAELPGFPRALALHESLAFVGVSAHRDRDQDDCGVWVVDIDAGRVVAFVRFETGVDEVTAVHVLAGSAYAAIAGPETDAALNSFLLPDG